MILDLLTAHERALDATGRIVAGIAPDQYGRATPCDGWDVRTLLDHVISGNWWVAPLVGGQTIDEVGDRYDGDQIGDDLAAAWHASAAAAHEAFAAPGALDAPCAVSYGPVPGSVYCGHRVNDVLIHGWDLAVATGQDTTLDPDLVETLWESIQPEREMLAASGAFGTPTDLGDDVALQQRLLAALGRTA